MLSTSLFSQQWIPVGEDILPDNFYTWSLSAVDENTVFAICENDDYTEQKLVRTTDGGITWNVVDLSIMPGIPQDIHAISADTIWIVYRESSGTARLYLSTDAGQTLDVKHSYQGSFVIGPALQFGGETSGYMIDPTVIKASHTNDGGATWQSNNMMPFTSGETWGMANPTNWMDAKGNTIWWGTSKFIHRSTDNGATWESFDNGFSDNAETKCITFSQCGLGLAASNTTPAGVLGETHISSSSDGGATWTELPIVDIPLEGITDVPGIDGAFVGVGGIFKDFVPGLTHQYVSAYTLDGGLNWTVMDDFPLNAVEFVSPVAGWAGTILSHDYGGNPVLFKWSGNLPGNKLFVNDDATGTNNGSSWADAYTNLQSALAIAEEGDQIWVAEGTYLPGSDPTSTFLIDKNLKLYGGFAGMECNLSERDIVLHPTILSGDLNGDDVDDNFVMNRGDNVMTVVTINSNISNETVIDGFTIRNGHADGVITTNSEQNGGGVYSTGSPRLKSCILKQNYAILGGGALGQNANTGQGLSLENCVFEKNRANSGGGARVITTNFLIDNCTFQQNESFDGTFQANEGGLGIVNSSGTVRNCFFIENNAFDFTGGMGIWNPAGTGNSEVEVIDCIFNGNSSNFGVGGLSFLSFGSNTTYTAEGCSFIGNSSAFGGGMSIITVNTASTNTSFIIDSCNFSQNSAERGGAIAAELDGSGVNFGFSTQLSMETLLLNDYATANIWSLQHSTLPNCGRGNCFFENNNATNRRVGYWEWSELRAIRFYHFQLFFFGQPCRKILRRFRHLGRCRVFPHIYGGGLSNQWQRC
ncbi:MAG: hypothetical protein IPM82_08145 [Saprospiraceae bacterium]|nr:hypothetical protein [Saprospiraceae bacterium]